MTIFQHKIIVFQGNFSIISSFSIEKSNQKVGICIAIRYQISSHGPLNSQPSPTTLHGPPPSLVVSGDGRAVASINSACVQYVSGMYGATASPAASKCSKSNRLLWRRLAQPTRSTVEPWLLWWQAISQSCSRDWGVVRGACGLT